MLLNRTNDPPKDSTYQETTASLNSQSMIYVYWTDIFTFRIHFKSYSNRHSIRYANSLKEECAGTGF